LATISGLNSGVGVVTGAGRGNDKNEGVDAFALEVQPKGNLCNEAPPVIFLV